MYTRMLWQKAVQRLYAKPVSWIKTAGVMAKSSRNFAPKGGWMVPTALTATLATVGLVANGNSEQSAPAESSARSGPRLAVFSGGTGFNSTSQLLKALTTNVTYVMPVSDDGGSTAEIARVLGGPAVGDIRSRLINLAEETTTQQKAVKALLKHRLSANGEDDSQARSEWRQIVEGSHSLWRGMSEACKCTIRAFLVQFDHDVLQHADNRFDFRNGSVGNFFFAGARTFFQSMEATIFLFCGVTDIPRSTAVVPAVETNKRVTIGCELASGAVVIGQSQISHPQAGEPGQESSLVVVKRNPPPLPSSIKRMFYVNEDHQPTWPPVNQGVIRRVGKASHVIYSQGSLYTSIVPCLILRGVGETVRAVGGRKVLILNGNVDRETAKMSAMDFVMAVTNGLNRYGELKCPVSAMVNTVLVPKGGSIHVDVDALNRIGIEVHEVDSVTSVESGTTEAAPSPGGYTTPPLSPAQSSSATVSAVSSSSLALLYDDRALVRCIAELTQPSEVAAASFAKGLRRNCGSGQRRESDR